jgi:hypothetical protein
MNLALQEFLSCDCLTILVFDVVDVLLLCNVYDNRVHILLQIMMMIVL